MTDLTLEEKTDYAVHRAKMTGVGGRLTLRGYLVAKAELERASAPGCGFDAMPERDLKQEVDRT